MQNTFFSVLGLIAPLCLAATIAIAAPPAKIAEDRYIAARDAAIEKISTIYDAATATMPRARPRPPVPTCWNRCGRLSASPPQGFWPRQAQPRDLLQRRRRLWRARRPALQLRLGNNGEKAGRNGADGKYVEPRAHIIVATQSMFERWLSTHEEWWGEKTKNVPQRIGAALKDETFYTQRFRAARRGEFRHAADRQAGHRHLLPCDVGGANPGRLPDAADEVFVAALANGKAYVASGTIKPKVQVPACIAIRTSYDKKAEQAARRSPVQPDRQEGLRQARRHQAEGRRRLQALLRRAPQQTSFAEASRQAQALLSAALNTR